MEFFHCFLFQFLQPFSSLQVCICCFVLRMFGFVSSGLTMNWKLSVLQPHVSLTAAAAVWWWLATIWRSTLAPPWCCSVSAGAWFGPGTGWGTDRGWCTGTCIEIIRTMPWRGWWICFPQVIRGCTTLTTWAGSPSTRQPSRMETSHWSSKVEPLFHHHVCERDCFVPQQNALLLWFLKLSIKETVHNSILANSFCFSLCWTKIRKEAWSMVNRTLPGSIFSLRDVTKEISLRYFV